jgi:hypothetical protein
MKMLVKGKLKLLPPKSKSTKEVKLIFEKVERGASH